MLCEDGQCDSPGKSAKYCTYTLMYSENNMILYVETIIDKCEVGLKSPNMEREAFMQYLTDKGIKISEVVIDASTAIIFIAGTSLISLYLPCSMVLYLYFSQCLS